MKQAKDLLSPSIDSFLSMVTVEKGLAKNTIEAYSRDLAGLVDFLMAHHVPAWHDVDSTRIRSYLATLRRKGLAPRSVARHAVTLRRLFRFLESEGLVKENPMPKLLLAGARKLPQTLSADDIRKLLGQPDPSEPLGARDQAMLELLYATGLRVSELVQLQTQRVSFQGDYLTVKVYEPGQTATAQRQVQLVCVHQSVWKTFEPTGLLEAHAPLCAGCRH